MFFYIKTTWKNINLLFKITEIPNKGGLDMKFSWNNNYSECFSSVGLKMLCERGHRWGNQGTEKQCDLLKVTQQSSGRARNRTHVSWYPVNMYARQHHSPSTTHQFSNYSEKKKNTNELTKSKLLPCSNYRYKSGNSMLLFGDYALLKYLY